MSFPHLRPLARAARLRHAVLLAFGPALLAPLAAHATNGYFSQGFGIKSQGMAGVGIALPQDSLAAAANPAGTALVGTRADLGLSYFVPDRGARISAPSPLAGRYNGNDRNDFFIPDAGYTRNLGPDRAIGLAIYGNGGMNTDYQRNPFGAPGNAGVNFEQAFITPSLAWRVDERHTFGVAVNFAYQRFRARGLQAFANPVFSVSPGNVTNRGYDSATGWGLRLGWIGQITPELSLGASWASTIRTGDFDKYKGLFAEGGGFDIPQNYGIGLAWKPTAATTLAADVQTVKFSATDSVGNDLGNPFATPLGSVNGSGFGWRDVTTTKLGISHALNSNLTVRAGISHNRQPVPRDQTFFNILAPGLIEHHLSVGATWRFERSEMSLAYTHGFRKTVKGSGSIPAALGGGEADIHLKEDILGISWGWML